MSRQHIPDSCCPHINVVPSDADDYLTSSHVEVPKLASIPPELFDEIITYYPVLPLNWHYDTSPTGFPDLMYLERYTVLRALADTCKALRVVSLPRLWSRLDACLVPERARGTWYKYVMQELKRKAPGVCRAQYDLKSRVRSVSFSKGHLRRIS